MRTEPLRCAYCGHSAPSLRSYLGMGMVDATCHAYLTAHPTTFHAVPRFERYETVTEWRWAPIDDEMHATAQAWVAAGRPDDGADPFDFLDGRTT
jgi:hypothetical protein